MSRDALAAFNDRLNHVETTVGERLLAFHQGLQAQNAAISGVQEELRKLVSISEKQVELSAHFTHQSDGLKRAFRAIETAAEGFTKWRENHEKDNAEVSKTVTRHQTAAWVITAVFGIVAAVSTAYIAGEFRRVDEARIGGDDRVRQALQGHISQENEDNRRIENRLDRLERAGDGR